MCADYASHREPPRGRNHSANHSAGSDGLQHRIQPPAALPIAKWYRRRDRLGVKRNCCEPSFVAVHLRARRFPLPPAPPLNAGVAARFGAPGADAAHFKRGWPVIIDKTQRRAQKSRPRRSFPVRHPAR